MKFGFALFAFFAVATLGEARPAAFWTYEKLTSDADLVVIAMPMETLDKDHTVIPNMQRVGPDGKYVPVPAVGIETKFKVHSVLKGDKKLSDFVLYHLREAKPENIPNGPQLISFNLKEQKRDLLFLKHETDGRFVSLTGQIDSAVGIKDLGSYP